MTRAETRDIPTTGPVATNGRPGPAAPPEDAPPVDPSTDVAEAVRSTRFVTVHGYRRAFRMAGSGPALLLVHGIGDSSSSWVPVMPALAERYTVIAPDLLGHGNSD